MKKETFYIFKIKDIEVERVDWDIDVNDVDIIKGCIAFIKGTDVDDIDMEKVEVFEPELSDLFVREDGSLMKFQKFPYSNPRYIKGVSPALDINHEELFYEFLDLISKKDIDNAIIFS